MSQPSTIKAIRYHGNHDVRVDEIPAPTNSLQEGEVRLAPAWAGICGTDVGEYAYGPNLISTHAHPHPISGTTTPLTWGHEFSALVTEVHPSVTTLHPGSRVVIEPIGSDGTCHSCLAGIPHLCENLYLYGIHANGGMAQSVTIPAKCCYELPESISLEIGALVEPLAVAWNGILVSGIKKGETALVIGTGSIGLATVLCLRAMGVERVVASGRSQSRNEILKEWGVEAVLDAGKEDVAVRTKEIFETYGAHAVFDTACSQVSVDIGLSSLRKGGVFHTFGFYGEKVALDFNQIVASSLRVTSDIIYAVGVFPAVIAAIADGRLDQNLLKTMITTRVSIDDFVKKGIEDLVANKSKHLKILVEIHGGN